MNAVEPELGKDPLPLPEATVRTLKKPLEISSRAHAKASFIQTYLDDNPGLA